MERLLGGRLLNQVVKESEGDPNGRKRFWNSGEREQGRPGRNSLSLSCAQDPGGGPGKEKLSCLIASGYSWCECWALPTQQQRGWELRVCGLEIRNPLVPWVSPQALLWSEPTQTPLGSALNP